MPKQLTKNPSSDANPGWSADGKWIYFQSDRSRPEAGFGRCLLMVARRFQCRESAVGAPVESPDGKFLYYDKGWPDNYGIWRVPTSGGTESQVIDSVHPEGGWVVVAEGIYFISKPDEKGVSYIRFKDLATGSIRTIAPDQR